MFEGVILISLGGNWGYFIDYSPLKEINLKDYHSFSSSLKHLNSMLCNFDSLFNALLEIDGDIYSKKPKVKFYEIPPKQSIPKREKVMIRKYDESFTPKEIELIDKLIDLSIKKGKLVSKKELFKDLK